MAKTDLTQKQTKEVTLNKTVALPKDRYTLHCLEEKFVTTKTSGQPMIVRTFEFVTESVEMPDGSKLRLAGTQLIVNYVLKSLGTAKSTPEKATAFLLDKFKEDTSKCIPEGIDWANFDDENPPLLMKGVTVDAMCGDKPDIERRAPKPGQKEGTPILGPDGKPSVTHQATVISFYGPSVTKINQPY